jgi:hypothetical protein
MCHSIRKYRATQRVSLYRSIELHTYVSLYRRIELHTYVSLYFCIELYKSSAMIFPSLKKLLKIKMLYSNRMKDSYVFQVVTRETFLCVEIMNGGFNLDLNNAK